jgi:hypothetical protein
MRLDLHNHTIPSFSQSSQWNKNFYQHCKEICLQAIEEHCLDWIAITDFQDITAAEKLAEECPGNILVGAEYQVLVSESTTAQIVVLCLNQNLHQKFMKARLRGIEFFEKIAKEFDLPYFLTHVGWGIPFHACEILESILSHCYGIETMNVPDDHISFSQGLAQYYQLAEIGGSQHLISNTSRRAYTESLTAKTLSDFWVAIKEKKVKPQITTSCQNPTRDSFQKYIQEIWHSEWGWHREQIENVGKNIILSFFQWLPHHCYAQQTKQYRKKTLQLEQRFVQYLTTKESNRIFALDIPLEEKKQSWEQAMNKISSCFGKKILITS